VGTATLRDLFIGIRRIAHAWGTPSHDLGMYKLVL